MQTYSELLPMPGYIEVLAALHRLEKPRNYLEIGIHKGESLQLANNRTFCVGVDPDPRVPPEIEEHCHIERTTSDDFFGGPRVQELFGGRPIDMAFIDGMHLFEYALRDFINIERHSDQHTLVIVHDFLPHDMRAASRERTGGTWMGDVWKLLLVLNDHRPDLEICLVNAPPSGLGLIQGLNASSDVLAHAYEDLVTEYGGLTFADWEDRQQDLVPQLLTSRQSVRWRKRLTRRITFSIWLARARHPARSMGRRLSRA